MRIFGLTTPGIELASKSLNFVAESTSQISSNIANISTPGYKAYEFRDFEGMLANALKTKWNGGMTRTNPRHLPIMNLNRIKGVPLQTDENPGMDGNSVNIDKEGVKLAKNQINYSAYSTIVDNELGSMKRVISLSAR